MSELSEGHSFVFDGYNVSNQFDVNWGWAGFPMDILLLEHLTRLDMLLIQITRQW